MASRAGSTTPVDKLSILRNHSLFGQLDVDALTRLASYSHSKSVSAGTTIFERGDPGTSLFAVLRGTVKISNQSSDGKDAVLNMIPAGGIFGEIALLDGQPRTADAFAVSDCELMQIDRRDFVPLISQRPEIALKLIEILCSRIRHTSEQVEDMTFLDLPGRLAKTLLWLSEQSGSSAGRKVSITQREIGQIIGMSRESTNKQLREWEEKKWLKLERGGLVILDPRPLAEILTSGQDED
ncbi:MAG TPA: Crp/Fnr family transcriptional regulator [Xanthobacteraceae bacterium]|jgi:CRP/FNR family transcriptional regulator, cyclic AMP receptor protein|nr:Crp/Fnr family transcriptional regulator [Xanthobacteraceae bacterium]